MPVVLSATDDRLREWTTAQARPVERLDYWVGAICEAFLEMDCSSRAADFFDGRLTHLPRPCASLLPDRQLDHPWHVKQGGQFMHPRPGDAVLVDVAQPCELHIPPAVACLSVHIQRGWVGDTVAERCRQLRLDHARQLLSQCRLASLSMAEVDSSCGRTDPSISDATSSAMRA